MIILGHGSESVTVGMSISLSHMYRDMLIFAQLHSPHFIPELCFILDTYCKGAQTVINCDSYYIEVKHIIFWVLYLIEFVFLHVSLLSLPLI